LLCLLSQIGNSFGKQHWPFCLLCRFEFETMDDVVHVVRSVAANVVLDAEEALVESEIKLVLVMIELNASTIMSAPRSGAMPRASN